MVEGPPTLLLVDGHQGVRSVLASRLRRVARIGAVYEAATVHAGVLLAQQHDPRLVLFDPRTIAFDAAPAVALLAGQQRRVLVFTSSLQDGEADRLLGAGCAAIALKGLPFAALLGLLESLLPN